MIALIQASIIFGTVILFGAIGELLTEKVGNLNLGVPGIMYLSGIASLVGAFYYERLCENPSPAVAFIVVLLCALVAAALSGLLFCFMTVTLRCNQNIMGLAFNIFAAGVANFYGGSLNKLTGGVGQLRVQVASKAIRTKIPFLSDHLGVVSEIFFNYSFLAYLAVILAFAVRWFLMKTTVGLNLRAVGESPSAADAVGINVTKYKYIGTMIGAMISGLGGVYFVMDYIKGTWDNSGSVDALGWLAVALVIFASWRPLRCIWGAYLFGMLSWAFFYIPGLTRRSQELFKMLPYVFTLFVLIFVAMQHKVENEPPHSLGQAYFREDR